MPDEPQSSFDYASFWDGVASRYAADDPLGAVCWDGAPLWFNRFFASLQVRSMERALRELQGGERRKGRALDIGCGTGRWTRWLGRWWTDPVGVDLSGAMLRGGAARQRAQGDITRLPFADATFDLAASVTVLQHLPHDAQSLAVAEAARVLRPGSGFVLLEMTQDVAVRAHVFPRSIGGWRSLLSRHGFAVRSVRGSAYVPLIRAGMAVARRVSDDAATEPAAATDVVKLGGRREATSATISSLPWPARAGVHAAVLASYGVEIVAGLAPASAATHACIVARRR